MYIMGLVVQGEGRDQTRGTEVPPAVYPVTSICRFSGDGSAVYPVTSVCCFSGDGFAVYPATSICRFSGGGLVSVLTCTRTSACAHPCSLASRCTVCHWPG